MLVGARSRAINLTSHVHQARLYGRRFKSQVLKVCWNRVYKKGYSIAVPLVLFVAVYLEILAFN